MSTPRPSEADVEALARVLLAELACYTLPANYNRPVGAGETHEDVARRCAPQIAARLLASDWLAARHAEHERVAEVGAYAAQKEATARAVADAARMAQIAAKRTRELAAAERALADLRGEIKALADEWVRDEDEGIEHVVGCQDYRCRECVVIACAADLRALLPRDDAAGAGGAG